MNLRFTYVPVMSLLLLSSVPLYIYISVVWSFIFLLGNIWTVSSFLQFSIKLLEHSHVGFHGEKVQA